MDSVTVEIFMKLFESVRKRHHLSPNEMIKKCNINSGTLTKWRDGSTKNVHPKHIRNIQDAFGIDVSLKDDGEWDIKDVGESRGQQTRQESNGLLAETDNGDWGKIRSYLLHHDLDSLDKVKRLLQRCEELEALYMSFEDHARKIKLRDKNNEG